MAGIDGSLERRSRTLSRPARSVQPMPVLNRIAALAPEMAEWRQALHRRPEVGFDCQGRRPSWRNGCASSASTRSTRGMATSGLVALIRGQGAGTGHRPARRHGRAADGRGDGAAACLARCRGGCMPAAMTGTRRCCWARRSTWPRRATSLARVALIFQPAEEDGGGAGRDGARGCARPFRHRAGLRAPQRAGHCRWGSSGPRRGRSWRPSTPSRSR